MFGNYRAAFSAPGAVAFSAASFLMRLPMAMYPLGLILLISTRTHHYGFGGVLSGAYVLGSAAGNPLCGRLLDRYGQGRVLLPVTTGHVGAAIALILLAREHAPDLTLLAPAVAMGFFYLPVGSMVRARWSNLLDGRAELATAYSFESTADEVIYIVAPLLASVIATQVDPVLVIVLGGAFVAIGALWLAPQHETQPAPHPVGEPRRQSALRQRGLPLMCAVAMAMGALFASGEVAIVAFCGRHGAQSLTGPVLAGMAVGSASAGLWYGARTWQRPLLERFRIQAIIFGVAPWVFLAAANVGELTACGFIVGLAVAPSLITLLGLVGRVVASAALTEGLAWVFTGLNVGYGLGAALVGRVSDAWGTTAAFGVTIIASSTMAVLAIWLYAVLRPTFADVATNVG